MVTRAQKHESVEQLKRVFSDSKSIMLAHNLGLDADSTTALRNVAHKSGVGVRVAKNTLAKIAANDTEFNVLAAQFTGPTTIAYSTDEIAAAKMLVEFAKKNEKLVIVGGSVNGTLLDAQGVESLAKMPSLDQSRAQLIGLINAPASQIARLLSAPGAQLARVFNAYAQKDATA